MTEFPLEYALADAVAGIERPNEFGSPARNFEFEIGPGGVVIAVWPVEPFYWGA
jgi:hypothetical protein